MDCNAQVEIHNSKVGGDLSGVWGSGLMKRRGIRIIIEDNSNHVNYDINYKLKNKVLNFDSYIWNWTCTE